MLKSTFAIPETELFDNYRNTHTHTHIKLILFWFYTYKHIWSLVQKEKWSVDLMSSHEIWVDKLSQTLCGKAKDLK